MTRRGCGCCADDIECCAAIDCTYPADAISNLSVTDNRIPGFEVAFAQNGASSRDPTDNCVWQVPTISDQTPPATVTFTVRVTSLQWTVDRPGGIPQLTASHSGTCDTTSVNVTQPSDPTNHFGSFDVAETDDCPPP